MSASQGCIHRSCCQCYAQTTSTTANIANSSKMTVNQKVSALPGSPWLYVHITAVLLIAPGFQKCVSFWPQLKDTALSVRGMLLAFLLLNCASVLLQQVSQYIFPGTVWQTSRSEHCLVLSFIIRRVLLLEISYQFVFSKNRTFKVYRLFARSL